MCTVPIAPVWLGLGNHASHVAALLFKIELGVRFGLTKKCVTSEACKWNQVFKNEVNPCTVLEIQHLLDTNRKKEIRCVIPSGKDALPPTDGLKSLYLVCPNAAFFTSIPPVHQKQTTDNPTRTPVSLPPVLTTLYSEDYKTLSEEDLKSACVTLYNLTKCSQEQSDILFARTKGQNVSPLWFEHRRGRVTGTKAHDIWTLKELTDPSNLIMRIMDYKCYDLSKKEAVKWGVDMEGKARKLYCEHIGASHKNFNMQQSGFRISLCNAFFGATADGIVHCICCGRGTIEIKCPFKHRHVTVQKATTDSAFCLSSDLTLKTSHRYYTQVQWQMFVFDCSYCDFIVMTLPISGSSIVSVRVYRNDKFVQALNEKCCQFVKAHVLKEILTRTLKDSPVCSKPSSHDELWCICREPEYGKMIFCEGPDCEIGWFHYACVDMRRKPRGKWLCKGCRN